MGKNHQKRFQKPVATFSVPKAVFNSAEQVATQKANQIAERIALRAIKDFLNNIGMAVEGTLREELGFGKVRIDRFMNSLNNRMPDHAQVPTVWRQKISFDGVMDLTELLLDFECGYDRCSGEDHERCSLYNALSIRGVEPYDHEAKGCPYRVTPGENPGKLTEDQIRLLTQMINDRFQRDKEGKYV